MSPDIQEVIHTRLDYMEEKFDQKLGQMADAMSLMANSITKLTDKVSDIQVINERSNQHSRQIDTHDRRLDEFEKKVPLYDQVVEDRKANASLIRKSVLGTLISLIVVGIAGLVWTAIVN